MEPGEDIYEASQREVLEETGLHFDPSTLLVIESAGEIVKPQIKVVHGRFSVRFERPLLLSAEVLREIACFVLFSLLCCATGRKTHEISQLRPP